MRRNVVLRSLLSTLPALALAGCFGSSSGGGGPDANFTQPDGEAFDSSMTEPDSSVDSSTTDVTTEAAPPVDSGLHEAAVEAEAGPSPVVVNVTNAAGPENGVTVVFQDASGNVVMPATTVSGSASYLAAAGSQVTVVMGSAALPYLVTIQGIAPGDVLAVYDPTADLAYVGDQVNVGAVPTPPESESYSAALGVGCSNTLAYFPIVTPVGPGCVVDGQVQVLVTANDVMSGGSEYTWQKGLALSDAGVTDAAVTNPWSSSVATVDLAETLPAYSYELYGTASLEMVSGGIPFTVSGEIEEQYITQVDAGLQASFSYPVGFPDGVQLETGLYSQNEYPGIGITTVATRSAPGADASVAVDLSQLPPPLTGATVDTTNPAQPVITWSPNDAGALAASDGLVVSLLWEVGSGNASGVWTFVAPPSATQVQVPLLPSTVTAFATDGGVFFDNPPTVAYVNTSIVGGYAALRAQAGTAGLTSVMVAADTSNNGGYLGGPIVPPLPANGTLQMTAVTRSGD